MITRTLIDNRSITNEQLEADLSSLRRLLAAAVINQFYCELLLKTPAQAVKAGFGGEMFPMSEATLTVVAAVKAGTLSEFIYSINEKIPIL